MPKRKITIYGPPISSGTRDAFEEIILQYQTEEMKVYRDAGLKGYRIIRSDGVYIPSGENDNLIVKKLTKDLDALGIFGYSFLAENDDIIQGFKLIRLPQRLNPLHPNSTPFPEASSSM